MRTILMFPSISADDPLDFSRFKSLAEDCFPRSGKASREECANRPLGLQIILASLLHFWVMRQLMQTGLHARCRESA
ncbi:MAG: hypothetical protein WC485_11620, partial [Opitutaceae bacterium]